VRQGLFIVFEGIDGSGKSTQIARLADHMRDRERTVVLTREPGGTSAAEAIRSIVLDPAHAGLDDRAEALLFAAARADHVARVIRPALQRGEVVLSDRYIDSSVVYQGTARGLGEERIAELSAWASGDLLPHVTVVLDLPADVGLARAGTADRIEASGVEFAESVRRGYLAAAQRDPSRYLVVDASGDVDDVSAAIINGIAAWT
jgi:dTMP kinase